MVLDLSDYLPTPDVASASTLPARWYVDPAILAAEREAVFARTWQWAGPSARLRGPGDYLACEAAGDPLFAVRGRDGVLRAFWNVCQHRAGRIVEGCGNAPALQCRYHGWTYGLDGRLMRVREMEGVEGFRPEEVQVRNVDEATPNRLAVRIALLEFLGSFCRARLESEAAPEFAIIADFSANLMRDLGVKEGQTLTIALPAECLHVFAKG